MANAGTIAQAYVQILPSAEGIKGSLTQVLGGEAESAGTSTGSALAGKIKAAIAAAGIGAAVTKGLKEAISAGADLQQSYMGGVDTLYKEAADSVRSYADEAAKAGISANDYSEQAVSFGASLKQAFGGDAVKAAEAANTAIMDMADNSAKMGSDVGSIQYAYQGFAKQNYTMLDNLKLGYGGTKTEMERLLSDAEKLHTQTTGEATHYDISNLGDVYAAIHDVQQNLGLTGVAADEASTTFSGSLGAMKASAENFAGALTLGQNVQPALEQLLSSAETFFTGNMLPMLGTIGESLVQSAPVIVDKVGQLLQMGGQKIVEYAPQAIAYGGQLIDQFISGMTGKESTLGTSISGGLTSALKVFSDVVTTISDGWNSLSPEMQGFIVKFGLIAAAAAPVIGIGAKVAPVITAVGSGIGGIVGKIGGLTGKISGLGSAASTASAPVSAGASSVGALSKNALGLVAAGAGILMASAGLALLAKSAIDIAAAGPGAAIAMVAMVGALAVMAVGAAALAPALTAGAVGLVAFGAGLALIGVGVLAATAGVALLATQLPTISIYGGSAAIALTQLGASLVVFSAGAIAGAAGAVVLAAGVLPLGASLILAGSGALIAAAGITALSGASLLVTAALLALNIAVKGMSVSVKAGSTSLIAIASSSAKGALGLTKFGVAAGAAFLPIAAGAASVGVLDVAMAAFAITAAASAAGVGVLDVAMLALAAEMKTIASSSVTAGANMQSMVTAVNVVQTGLNALKDTASNAVNAFIGVFTNSTPAATTAATALTAAMTLSFAKSITDMKTSTATSMTQLNASMVTALSSMNKSTTEYMARALNTIQKSIGDMQSAFANAHFEFGHIKLPHFSLNGSFDASSGSVPTVGVDWYANGGILTSPTIFGMSGSSLLGGGEAGAEAVLPLTTLKTFISDALEEHQGSDGGYTQNLYITAPTPLSPSEVARQTRIANRQYALASRGL